MKQTKDRFIAIDYFRGICILIVLLSHSALFSMPLAYASGLGRLWVSAAEIFFMLSGITFGIIRGPQLITDFRGVLRKTIKRAAIIYALNFLLILYAVVVGYFAVTHSLTYYGTNSLPTQSGLPLLWQILLLRSPLGWADFLMYFSVLLIVAPFAYRLLRSRFWLAVPGLSLIIFLLHSTIPGYGYFAVWQAYFVMGLTVARFRLPITGLYYRLSRILKKTIYVTASAAAALIIVASSLLSFNLYPTVNTLADEGWLPRKVLGAYTHLLKHSKDLNYWFEGARTGTLRLLAALIIFGAFYLFYQKHKDFLLKKTGKVVNQFGSETLTVYVAQAIVLPLLAMLPLKFGGLLINLVVTSVFFYLMWLAVQRRRVAGRLRSYIGELKSSYNQAKYAYLYNPENES
jgi:hypothetical protein